MSKIESEIFYHGSGILFESFDLSHALEGDGKVKFGYGVYVTSSYGSAAHYSGSNEAWNKHFVYTLRIPAKRPDNYIAFKQPVNRVIVERAEAKLGVAIADKYTVGGKEFRKYLADRFAKEIARWSGRKPAECKLEGEKAASEFLVSIGVEFIEWPYSWANPDKGSNRAVLDDSAIEIIQVDQVQLDDKKQLIPGSHKTIK